MLYLIGQIIFCLLLAAILGFLLGWLLKGRFMGKTKDESDTARLKESESAQLIETKENLVSEKAPAKSEQIAKTSPKAASKKDNLKKINGIGPVIEKRLNRMGIKTFDQIARFTDQDIVKYSEQIGAFPDRILRDKWVDQAAKLRNKK